MSRATRLAVGAALTLGGLGLGIGLDPGALADSFTPIQLGITLANAAHRGTALPITVTITADADALDAAAPLVMQVKLAPECGGTWSGTSGTVLLNKHLSPQPTPGQAYTATLAGSGKPTRQGVQTVCAFLEEQGDSRIYATSQAFTVNVLRPLPKPKPRPKRTPRPKPKRKVQHR